MNTLPDDEKMSDAEIARRRDEVIKRMINTPPRPHKPLGKPKPKFGAKAEKESGQKKK